jgi:ascorbate PTS system EIIC component
LATGLFGKMFEHAFHIKGIIPNNEAIVALAQKTFGAETAMIMVFDMVVNNLLVRFTKCKYIFLTGHHICGHLQFFCVIHV